MARGRMLSKDISLDEKVNALSDDSAQLLLTWLIPHLDCEGRTYGEAGVVKAMVIPRHNWSNKRVEKYLTEMEKLGLIARYSLNGNSYLFAPNFDKHQVGLRKERESQSKIPPPPPDLVRSDDGVSPIEIKGKEKLNTNIKNNTYTDNSLLKKKQRGSPAEEPDGYIKGRYSHMVKR